MKKNLYLLVLLTSFIIPIACSKVSSPTTATGSPVTAQDMNQPTSIYVSPLTSITFTPIPQIVLSPSSKDSSCKKWPTISFTPNPARKKHRDPCIDSGDGYDAGLDGPATFYAVTTPSLIFEGPITWGNPCGNSTWLSIPGVEVPPVYPMAGIADLRCFNISSASDLNGTFTLTYEGQDIVSVIVNGSAANQPCTDCAITTCQTLTIPNNLLQLGENKLEVIASSFGSDNIGMDFEFCGPFEPLYCFSTFTPTLTNTPTITQTNTPTPTITPTMTPSNTPTPSLTLSITSTVSITTTNTTTPTPSSTEGSITPTASQSPSGSPTLTPSPSPTTSVTTTPTCPGFDYRVPLIPYFQGTAPWGSMDLDSSDLTISAKGCFLTCLAMLAQINPGALNLDLSNYQNAISKNGNLDQYKAAQYLGWPDAYDDVLPGSTDIVNALKQGRYVIAHVPSTTPAGHYVIVTGSVYDPQYPGCRYTIQDPNGNLDYHYLDQYGNPLELRTFGSNGNTTPAL